MRTTCVDEMLGTLAMASCAASVRSGMPATVAATFRVLGAAGFPCASAGGRRLGGGLLGRTHPAGQDQAGDEPEDEKERQEA